MSINTPVNYTVGDNFPYELLPTMLAPENFRYHSAACRLPHGGKAVVMWGQGVTVNGGDGDIHDGIRDFHAKRDWSKNFRHYATQEEWLAAGNKLP